MWAANAIDSQLELKQRAKTTNRNRTQHEIAPQSILQFLQEKLR